MPNFSAGVRHLYVPGLNEVTYNIDMGINSWLGIGRNYYVDCDQGTNDFTIRTYEYSDFIRPYAFDINRLSCAAMESINDIQRDTVSPKFLGWILTRYYYSAFFSAHCILKISSHCLSGISSDSLSKVVSATRNYGYTTGNQNKGQYNIVINSANNSFAFFKDPIYDNSHEGLWRRFLDFWIGMQPGIYGQLPQQDAQLISDKIDELREALGHWGSNGGNWLSRVRNEVNYSQSYGTWFPYKNHEKDWDKIYDMQDSCKKKPLDINLRSFRGKDLLYFVATCQLINAMSFDLLIDLRNSHPENKSFVNNGIIQYQKKYLKSSSYNDGLVSIS